MQARIAQNIMSFMERVNLVGKEVPAFGECMVALQQELVPAMPAIPDGIPPKHPAELAAE